MKRGFSGRLTPRKARAAAQNERRNVRRESGCSRRRNRSIRLRVKLGSNRECGMKRQGSQCFLVLAALLSTGVAACGQTNTLVIPREGKTAFGNVYGDPFFLNFNVQQVYASTEFSDAPADVLTITEIAFRAEETQQAIESTIDRLLLRMNVFPGSMEEVVEGKSGLIPPLARVFDAEGVRLVARPGSLEAFDLRFKLDPPFVYDRRLGQLVLLFSPAGSDISGRAGSVDGHLMGEDGSPSFQRGALIVPQRIGEPFVSGVVLVTQFTYKFIRAAISSIEKSGSFLKMDFTVLGDASFVQVEASARVDGTYSALTGVDLTTNDGRKFQAIMPLPGSNEFYRIAVR